MGILELVGTAITGVLTGGATGILGVIAQRFADYKNRQLDIQLEIAKFNHTVEVKKLDAEIMKQEYAARMEIAKVETEGASDVAASNAFAASYQLEPKQYTSGALTAVQRWWFVILDFIRGVIRPGLTIYLCVIVTLIWLEVRALLGENALTKEQAFELVKYLVGTICYVWTTVTLWYFGTRNRAKQPGSM